MSPKTSSQLDQDNSCFTTADTGPCVGISFCLPSRRIFIPHSWLQYAELSDNGTELHLSYTHSLVIITGSRLQELQEATESFALRTVREGSVCATERTGSASVIRIDIIEQTS
jgi:hypothetical protein